MLFKVKKREWEIVIAENFGRFRFRHIFLGQNLLFFPMRKWRKNVYDCILKKSQILEEKIGKFLKLLVKKDDFFLKNHIKTNFVTLIFPLSRDLPQNLG